MDFWFFFLSLMTEAILLRLALDSELETVLPSALTYAFKQLGDLFLSISSVVGIAAGNLLAICPRCSNNRDKVFANSSEQPTIVGDGKLSKYPKLVQSTNQQTESSLGHKLNRHSTPRVPIPKGHFGTCATHKGNIVGCATFFEHDTHEYKLLCHGELFFRPKGTHIFRTGITVPKEPGRLFTVKLDNAGSKVVTFCFGPTSRALGEVNGYAEFLPVQTCIASSQEAYGLKYAPGQGCIFDWVYGSRPSSPYQWDYSLRYDVGWMHSNPVTEELFHLDEESQIEPCPPFEGHRGSGSLGHSLNGLDLGLVNHVSPEETQFDFAQMDLINSDIQQANGAKLLASSSVLPDLPVPLTFSHPGAPVSASPTVASQSVLRRTCTICNRVLRRPSALKIHMNAHYGRKPFQCNECDYGSTNATNLQRHRHNRHASGGS
ncbi:unnamed protein product [Rhizoctonia solani]|uniref:C2H2-type domain-containing protein n=1 Tax=Rhizoctonia solani TaxID=456999 RepID=A0A8H3C6S9_9AGAM|nr:unnamed protein product [Rhizoctonia solani]